MPPSEDSPQEAPETDSVQQALGNANAPPSSASASSLTIAWRIEGPVAQRDARGVYNLELANHEDTPIDGTVVLEIYGLGSHRSQTLGTVTVPAHGQQTVAWAADSSPIAPSGTLARVRAEVRYAHDGMQQKIPARPLFVSYASTGQRSFASVEDGQHVRLASLGRASSGNPTDADRSAIRAALGSRRGRLDGKPVNETRVEATTKRAQRLAAESARTQSGVGKQPSAADESFGDTISRDGELGLNAVDPSVTPGPTLPYCPGATFPVEEPTCVTWRPSGFRDTDVVPAAGFDAPEETFHPTAARAAYANAAIKENGVVIWSGRLDSRGCTPVVVKYCPQNADVDVSTASFQNWISIAGSPQTREIRLTPTKTMSATVVLADSTITHRPIGAADVWPSSDEDDHLIRVAAVIGRVMTMTDNGLGSSNQPPLNVHTENGCCDPAYPFFQYTSPSGQSLCGEACGKANDAWFGEGLGLVGNTYYPNGTHTTEDAYTIGHELGHSIQLAANGGPYASDYTGPTSGSCSCDHVSDGNRVHCLQSKHRVDAAEAEGFAHFYATRVMNDLAHNARFTYYKNFRKFGWFTVGGIPVTGPQSIRPPFALNAGHAAWDPVLGQTEGWVRAVCPPEDGDVWRASEYDWLTFTWALNGKPVTSRWTMANLFSVLGSIPGGPDYTYPNLLSKTRTAFKKTPEKIARFETQAHNNGTDL